MFLKSTAATLALASFTALAPHAAAQADPVDRAIADFVRDYGQDPMAQDITFGIEVDGRRWTVVSHPSYGPPQLLNGFPDEPILYFTTSSEVMFEMYNGEMTGLTAMAASTSADITPLDIAYTQGYERPADYDEQIRPLIFHFWTRGLPETVPLTSANARIVHGAPGVVMYYYDDFRSAVYHVPVGLGREQAPTMAVPFPRVLVTLTGTMTGTVSERSFTLPAGHMVVVPPNQPAQIWNDGDEDLSLMFLMFGEGA